MSSSTFYTWWLAIRPPTLIASIAPVCMGGALSTAAGSFSPLIFFLTLLFALLIQIGTNFTNDFVDFVKGTDTEDRKGPLRVCQAGLVSVSLMKKATFFVFFLALITGCFLSLQSANTYFFFLTLLSILLGIAYTAGPFPLAYLGLGELFVLLFFGPVATGGTYLLQTGSISSASIIAGLIPGSLSSAILVVNNLRDEKEDRKANKNTLVVRFGRAFGVLEYKTALLIALLTPCILAFSHPHLAICALVLPMGWSLIQTIEQTTGEHLPKTAMLLSTFSLLFCLGAIF